MAVGIARFIAPIRVERSVSRDLSRQIHNPKSKIQNPKSEFLILCLGNEIVSDDGFGPAIAKRLIAAEDFSALAEVIFSPVAGFALLDLLAGRVRALIVDTIQTGTSPPGTLHWFEAGHLVPGRNLTTSHQISLPTALAFGRSIGSAMPERIDILAVEAGDLTTLSEQLTSPVAEAVEPALRQIKQWALNQSQIHNDERHNT